jgi:hypothetical protein
MQTRQSLILGSAVVVAALILGAFFGPRTAAQKTDLPGQLAKAEQSASVGRYQARQGPNGVVVVLDTATGQCWYNPNMRADGWENFGSPTQPKK